jgi:Ni/Fe-hydrogenase subunit HybB-like protein
MLSAWTVKRATGIGVTAGLAGAVIWAAYGYWSEALYIPALLAAAVTAFCGLSILWITLVDARLRGARAGRRMSFRVFDIALGLLLALPAILALRALLPEEWGL